VIPLAIVGWEEGHAGQIHSWIGKARAMHVSVFIHDEDQPPALDPAVVMNGREASQFDFPRDGRFKGVPLVCARGWPERVRALGIAHVLVTHGDERRRFTAIAAARAAGLTLVNAIHPSATILADAILGDNVILHARALIGYRAEVEAGAILNTGAQIDHHTVLRSCCTLDPGVICAGGVVIERFAHVGPGAVVTKRVRIGSGAEVAAGAVVLADVPAETRVMGVPARAG
jgi:sugar O-acyltransferase (sialic acid O-acetyltransferase NeuD family)